MQISTAAVAAAAAPTTGGRRHCMLFVLFFVYTMSMADRNIMGVMIQPIKEEFGVSDSAMGLLTGLAFALFYSVLAIPFGRYADRANRRNLVAYCCFAWSVATALCGMAVGFWTLAAARVAVAVGEAGGSAPSLSMIADAYPPQQRSRAMSIYMLGSHFGVLIGLGLGAWIAQEYGWRQLFLWMAVPGIAIALLLRLTCMEPARTGRASARPAVPGPTERFVDVLHALRKNRAFVGVAVAGVVLTFSGQAIGIWSTSFLVRSYGLSLKDAGAIFGVFGGGSAMVGALLSGWITDRLTRHDLRWQLWVPVIGVLVAMPFGIYFYLAPADGMWSVAGMQVPRAMPFYIVFAVCISSWVAPTYAALTNVVPSARVATAMAVFGIFASAIGGGLGPLMVGLISDALSASQGKESLRWALVSMVACCLLAVLSYLWSLKDYLQVMTAAKERPQP